MALSLATCRSWRSQPRVSALTICSSGAVNVAAAAGVEKVRLQPRDQGSVRRKPAFLDPVGGRPVGCIYFVDQHWAGKTSHRLLYIVQRLDEVNKEVIRRDKLKRRVSLGQDAFGGSAEYRKARRELAELERILVSQDVSKLPTRLSYRALPRWLGPAETPKTELSEDDEGYGWKPGQERGFERFYVGRVKPGV